MISALVIGMVGSLHCVGMCGPIMLTFAGPKQSPVTFIFYHFGRVLSYLIIGMLLGLVGESLHFFQIQQVLTIVLGVALLVIYTIPSFRNPLEKWYFQSFVYRQVNKVLARNLGRRRRWFVSGMANGFLPCGLTYVAAAGAVALGDFMEGAIFMLLFGLSTVPALAIVAMGGSWISTRLKAYIPRSVSFIAVLSGIIILLRGLLMTFPDFYQMVRVNAAGLITMCGV